MTDTKTTDAERILQLLHVSGKTLRQQDIAVCMNWPLCRVQMALLKRPEDSGIEHVLPDY